MSDRLSKLFEKYLDNDCTQNELQEFWGIIASLPDGDLLKEELKAAWEDNLTGTVSINKKELFDKVLARAEEVSKVYKVNTVRRNWTRVAAAAAIILMFGAGTWFLFFNQAARKEIALVPQEKRFENDIEPSHQGATLTLANGTKILLDSASNGKLTQQGNTQVMKQDDQVVYQSMVNGQQTTVQYNTMTTERGKQYVLTLSDGSKAWLNAASSITYPTAFSGNERKVTVTGEVYFEVTHNANLPFVVQKNSASSADRDVNIQVLGTHFNVNAYDDETAIKITLLEGSVRVSTDHGQQSTVIKPGQQAQIENPNNPIIPKIKVQTADVDEVMAWKNGLFSFDKVDLQTVLRQLTKWYDVDVEYRGSIPKQTFGGDMQRTLSLSQVLKVLEKSEVHFKIEGKKIIVMP